MQDNAAADLAGQEIRDPNREIDDDWFPYDNKTASMEYNVHFHYLTSYYFSDVLAGCNGQLATSARL